MYCICNKLCSYLSKVDGGKFEPPLCQQNSTKFLSFNIHIKVLMPGFNLNAIIHIYVNTYGNAF